MSCPSCTTWLGSAPVNMARVQGNSGVNITQATISSISRKTYRQGGTLISTDALVVADTIFDTLQTDNGWDVDAEGYNFKDQPDADDLSQAGKYIIVYVLTPVSGEPIVLDPFTITVKDPSKATGCC